MNTIKQSITISNMITLSRIILLPFIVYFLLNNQRFAAFAIMLISLLSDAVDGYVARKLHQESEAGKFLDPICDKISLTVILITLLMINSIPLWGVIIVVARDTLILLGSYIMWKYKSLVFKSHILGKITGFILGAIVLAYTLNWQRTGEILLYISIPAIIGTFTIYLGRYIKVMKGAQ
jgi:CDP-diacylglycerol--glycerol-3-phosphate 3-phosphatidyltransferase